MAWIQLALAAVGGFYGWALGGLDGFVFALLAFVVIDGITGIMCAMTDPVGAWYKRAIVAGGRGDRSPSTAVPRCPAGRVGSEVHHRPRELGTLEMADA